MASRTCWKKVSWSMLLFAKPSAQVPVSFFVREGPVEVIGNELRFTQIPPRSTFPVKVTLVAWH
jgi:hypothetical protein